MVESTFSFYRVHSCAWSRQLRYRGSRKVGLVSSI